MNSRQIKILMLPWQLSPGNYTSGSYTRLIHPFKTLSATDQSIHVEIGDQYYDGNFDAVIIEKIYKEEVAHDELYALVDKIKRNNALVIYEIDDNLYDLYSIDPQDTRALQLLSAVCWLTRNADAVICSTDELARIIKNSYNLQTYVFKNYLRKSYLPDLKRKNFRLKNNEQIEIGYMGTLTHLEDLKIVLNALKEVMFEYRNVSFHLIGIGDTQKIGEVIKPYPFEVHLPPTYKYDVFFPWFVKNFRWDIGIAPLADTPLNRSKSDLKLLDLASIGSAGIYSNVLPYFDIESTEIGLVVENTDENWYYGLKKLIEDKKLRGNIQNNAKNYLHENRVLEDNVYKLKEIIDRIFLAYSKFSKN